MPFVKTADAHLNTHTNAHMVMLQQLPCEVLTISLIAPTGEIDTVSLTAELP